MLVNLPFGWMTFGGCSFGVPGFFTSGVVFGEFKEGDYKNNKKINQKCCKGPHSFEFWQNEAAGSIATLPG